MRKNKLEKFEEELKECIEAIEQLGADARYWNDYERYDKVKDKLGSIQWWVKDAILLIDLKQKKEKAEQRNEGNK